ncbi:MAG: hypothetical protein ACREP9_21135, partial [Candidatus Dormibacteraceae bacterium]
PWRVRIRPDQVLEAQEWIPARELAYRMEYVRHWAPESWPLAFQGHIHQLAKVDFKLVENELRRSLRGRGKREENSNGRGNTLPEPTEELAPQAAELGGIGSMAGG